MPRVRRPQTPVAVKAAVVLVPLALLTFLVANHLDRVHNERRLAGIASRIAHRPVRVHCPGIVGQLLSWDMVEGTVHFDQDGRPADATDLRAPACAELDALSEGDRADVLACVEADPNACLPKAVALAEAVDTLTHESFHLAGILDEADTECHSLGEMARTAIRLGATPAQAAALTNVERTEVYPSMPDRYREACPAAIPTA